MQRASHADIMQIHGAAISLGLAEKRIALMGGINKEFVASLEVCRSPGEQLLADLHSMNNVHKLRDQSRPLVLWLQNAVSLVGLYAESQVLIDALSQLRADDADTAVTGRSVVPQDIFSCDARISLMIAHQHQPPRQFAYFRASTGLVKAYTGLEFKLDVRFANREDDEAIIETMVCRTLRYEPLAGRRVLVQTKAKGFFEPERFMFKPAASAFCEVDLFRGRCLRIRARGAEYFQTEMEEAATPGFYEVRFIARGFCKGKAITIISDLWRIMVADGGEDAAHVMVYGRHYDDPVERILDLPNEQWNMLAGEPSLPVMRYLGPLPSDVMKQRPYGNVWTIREETGTMHGEDTTMLSGDVVRELLRLDGSIKEKLYSLEEACERAGRYEVAQKLRKRKKRRK